MKQTPTEQAHPGATPQACGSSLHTTRHNPSDGEDSLLARLQRSEATRKLLDRYLPEAVRAHVERGIALDQGEREVTLLFADLQGFTGIAEPLSSGQIFHLLSDYTRRVSSQVQRHGGTVVEFNGDGMMAVFGALTDLESKERAAVAAARAIVREVTRFDSPLGRGLPVGIGVATGQAWIGCIECADRLIWSAVGNATNLGSRLEKLAHELSTPVVLDATTRRRAGAHARDFLCRAGTTIRGRSQPLDVWLLPWPHRN